MPNEVLQALAPERGGTFLDLTFGGGGHTRDILAASPKQNQVIAFDIDPAAPARAAALGFGDNLTLVNANFSQLTETLAQQKVEKVAGILADLGWSADQLESIPGLSYSGDPTARLDMRIDPSLGVTAADLLNGMTTTDLTQLWIDTADVRTDWARKLSAAINARRQLNAFQTVGDLLELINQSNSNAPAAVSRNLTARVFQALRIAVNLELSSLQSMLPQAWNALDTNGRLVVITFHSVEARFVTSFMYERVAAAGASWTLGQPFVQPGVAELRRNLSARSAQLHAITKR